MTHELPTIALVIEARKEALKPDLVKLRKMVQNPGYFKVRTPETAQELLSILAMKAKEFKGLFDNVAQGNETYEEEFRRVPNFLRSLGRSNHRRALEDIVIGRTKGITGNPLKRNLIYAMWGETDDTFDQQFSEGTMRSANNASMLTEAWLKWQALSDLPEIQGFPNPYDPIMDMLAMGCANINAVENTITADIPLIVGGHKRVLGCWRETDREIVFTHDWESKCKQAEPVQRGQLLS